MGHTLELSFWVSIAAVAFTGAHILLWRARRVLERSQAASISEVRPVLATAHGVDALTTRS